MELWPRDVLGIPRLPAGRVFVGETVQRKPHGENTREFVAFLTLLLRLSRMLTSLIRTVQS